MLGKLLNKIYDATPALTPAARKRDKELREVLANLDELNAKIREARNK